jgi:hypothetical protein
METLEFVIYPDGRVLEKVTGISGTSCAEVTAKIEAELGRVVAQSQTAEYFAVPAVLTTTQDTTLTNQARFSEW